MNECFQNDDKASNLPIRNNNVSRIVQTDVHIHGEIESSHVIAKISKPKRNETNAHQKCNAFSHTHTNTTHAHIST